jgi:hypothetical protein
MLIIHAPERNRTIAIYCNEIPRIVDNGIKQCHPAKTPAQLRASPVLAHAMRGKDIRSPRTTAPTWAPRARLLAGRRSDRARSNAAGHEVEPRGSSNSSPQSLAPFTSSALGLPAASRLISPTWAQPSTSAPSLASAERVTTP